MNKIQNLLKLGDLRTTGKSDEVVKLVLSKPPIFKEVVNASGSIQNEEKGISTRSLFKSSFIVTALNPKGIAFFVAFLPQFISPSESVFSQLLLLGGSFLFLALVNAALYAIFASQLREAIRKTSVRKWFNRCGGTALIGAGIFTAGMQRSV